MQTTAATSIPPQTEAQELPQAQQHPTCRLPSEILASLVEQFRSNYDTYACTETHPTEWNDRVSCLTTCTLKKLLSVSTEQASAGNVVSWQEVASCIDELYNKHATNFADSSTVIDPVLVEGGLLEKWMVDFCRTEGKNSFNSTIQDTVTKLKAAKPHLYIKAVMATCDECVAFAQSYSFTPLPTKTQPSLQPLTPIEMQQPNTVQMRLFAICRAVCYAPRVEQEEEL